MTKDEEIFYRFREFYIPGRMGGGITRYIENHIAPGDFLLFVLKNDFVSAIGHADAENMANLPAYAAYLYNEVASMCWGSDEKVEAWLEISKK